MAGQALTGALATALAAAAPLTAGQAVVAAVTVVAAVALGPGVAMGGGKVLCLGVHGGHTWRGRGLLLSLLFQHTQLYRGPNIPWLYSWGQL